MKIQPKQVLLAAGALFIGLTVWNNPSDAGDTTGEFIGGVISWAQDAFGKISEFSENVVN